MYKQYVQQLDGDGITKTVQQHGSAITTPRPQSSYESKAKPTLTQNTKRSEPIKSAPTHRSHVVKIKEALELKLDGGTTNRPSTSNNKRTAEGVVPSREVRTASATIGGRVYVSSLQKRNTMNEKAKYTSKEVTSIRSPLRVERPSTPVRLLYNNELRAPDLNKCTGKICTPQST